MATVQIDFDMSAPAPADGTGSLYRGVSQLRAARVQAHGTDAHARGAHAAGGIARGRTAQLVAASVAITTDDRPTSRQPTANISISMRHNPSIAACFARWILPSTNCASELRADGSR